MNIRSYEDSDQFSAPAAASLADLFKVLGDRTRIRVVLALQDGPLCVSCLAERLEMEQSAISHQLSVLRRNRLVKYERKGKQLFYSLDDDHVVALLALGLEHVREMPWIS